MSASSVKKELRTFTNEQLLHVVMELHRKFPDAKEFLEFYVAPDEEKLLDTFTHRLERAFGRRLLLKNIRKAEQVLKDFAKFEVSPEIQLALHVRFMTPLVRHFAVFNLDAKGASDALLRVFDRSMDVIVHNGLASKFLSVMEKLAFSVEKKPVGKELLALLEKERRMKDAEEEQG